MRFRFYTCLTLSIVASAFSGLVGAQPQAVPADFGDVKPLSSRENPVRFRLEVSGADRVFLAGTFNDWNSSAVRMEKEDNVFTAVVALPPGEHQYKFVVNGSDWRADPENPATVEDGVSAQNSVITVGRDGRVELKASSEESGPPSLNIEPLGEGKNRVTFQYRDPEAEEVYLSGSFNHWNPAKEEMTREDELYTAALTLEDGEYHYKFVVDGEWRKDPLNPEGADDNNQGENSVLRLGPAAYTRKSSERIADGRINDAGLEHKPSIIDYFNPLGNGDAVLKLRTMAGDATTVTVQRNAQQAQVMRSEYKDDRFETFTSRVAVSGTTDSVSARYSFNILDASGSGEVVRIAFGGEGATTSTEGVRPFEAVRSGDEIFRTPDWAKDVVWYEIFPERFRNGSKANDPQTTAFREWTSDWFRRAPDELSTAMEPGVFGRRYGGDLQGVVEKLPYLKELGVGAIWFNPVFKAESLHKYDATDFRHIDDHFGIAGDYAETAAQEDLLDADTWKWSGSDKLFLELVDKAHSAGMKVIVDGVFNHTGVDHPAFQDVMKNGRKSRFHDWYNVSSWEPFEYEGWGGYGTLPVFLENENGFVSESLKQHIRDVTRRWMDPNGDGDPSDGIDGWRLDVPNEVSDAWWREWRDLVKSVNPDAIIIGEIWDPPARWLKGDKFDSVMNYQMAQALTRFITNSGPATALSNDFAKLLHSVPEQANRVMMNLMNSHDTDRLASQLFNPGRGYDARNRQQDLRPGEYKSDKPDPQTYQKMKQLLGVQFAWTGSPMIYYGDESGMWGADDPEDRKPMIWQDLEPYEKPEENHFMPDIFAHFQRVAAIRNTLPALANGDYEALHADDAGRTFAFRRYNDQQTAVIATNDSGEAREVRIPLGPDAPTTFVELIADPAVKVVPGTMKRDSRTRVEIGAGAKSISVHAGMLTVKLQPHSTAILVSR